MSDEKELASIRDQIRDLNTRVDSYRRDSTDKHESHIFANGELRRSMQSLADKIIEQNSLIAGMRVAQAESATDRQAFQSRNDVMCQILQQNDETHGEAIEDIRAETKAQSEQLDKLISYNIRAEERATVLVEEAIKRQDRAHYWFKFVAVVVAVLTAAAGAAEYLLRKL